MRKFGSKLGSLENGQLSDRIEDSLTKVLLEGSTIVFIGHPAVREIDGGLCIDLEKEGTQYQLVLGYNDLGMWVHRLVHRENEDRLEKLFDRIKEFVIAMDGQAADPVLEEDARGLRIIVRCGSLELSLALSEIKLLPKAEREVFLNVPRDINSIMTSLVMLVDI